MIPRSATSKVRWPALPAPAGALLLAIQQQLQEDQWLAPEELERRQLEALAGLLEHARRTVPYYRDGDAYGALPRTVAKTAEAWRELPILTRADVQEAGEALTSDDIPADHMPLGHVVTSGSTGRPIRGVKTRVTKLFWLANTLRDHLWHQRDLTQKLVAIRPEPADGSIPSEGRELESWGSAVGTVYETGPAAVLSVSQDVAEQAEWLLRQDPVYLVTLPSVVSALARHFVSSGLRLPRLVQVSTFGEVVGPEVRSACREAWGVGLTDMYSTQEVDYLALQCPSAEHYHVQSETVHVEILDDHGEPCGPGEVGRVVVTPLHNYAMPLLRYELGDYAEVGPPCSCGRGLPVVNRILGRRMNLMTLPTGEKRWPMIPSREWADIGPIRQLQLVQWQLDHIEARIVGPRPLTPAEEEAFTSMVRRRLSYPFQVSFSYLERIDRNRDLKFDLFVSRLPA